MHPRYARLVLASFLSTLLSEGATIIDFRKINRFVSKEMRKSLKGNDLEYAFNATRKHSSCKNLSQVLANKGKLIPVSAFPEIQHTERHITAH